MYIEIPLHRITAQFQKIMVKVARIINFIVDVMLERKVVTIFTLYFNNKYASCIHRATPNALIIVQHPQLNGKFTSILK